MSEGEVPHETKRQRYEDVTDFIEDLCAEYPKHQASFLVSRALTEVGEERLKEWLAFMPLVFVEGYIDQHRQDLAERSRTRSPKAEVHNLGHKRREKGE